MKKTFLTVSLILSLAFCPVLADDYVDDAYYWDGLPRVAGSSTIVNTDVASPAASKDAATVKVKKVPSTVKKQLQESSPKVQSTNRPVTPTVEFIQEKDTVVKAVIHRNNR